MEGRASALLQRTHINTDKCFLKMPGTTDPLGACANSNSNLRTLLQTYSSGSSVRSLQCDPWENKGWGEDSGNCQRPPEAAPGQVPSLLRLLLCGLIFGRTKATWEVLFPTACAAEQSRDWHSWHSCPRMSSCLIKSTHKGPLHLLLGLKQATFSSIGEIQVETTTRLLLQILDFLIDSPQPAPKI